MNKKKLATMALLICFAATAVAGASLAYFTDTDDATNVFTVGSVDIDLREWKDNVDGAEFEDETNMMPGETYTKLVDVKNIGNSPAYVRVTVVVPEGLIPTWNENTEWVADASNPGTAGATTQGPAGTYVFTLPSALAANATTSVILKSVQLDPAVTELTAASSYKVEVNAEAIQAASFADAAAAYAALDDASMVAQKVQAANVAELNTALAGTDAVLVQMSNDVDSRENIVMANPKAVFDGNGKTIEKEAVAVGTGTNAGIAPVGGTIKNVTIKGETSADGANAKGFRAVYVTGALKNDLVLDNVNLTGTYAININSGSAYTLTVKNSTLDGWVSYGAIAGAEFTDVKFTTGNSLVPTSGADVYKNTIRPYADTVLTDCEFTTPYNFSAGAEGLTITLNDVTVGGTAVTAANFAELFTVDAADDLRSCTVVVDGVTVVW